MPAYEYSRVLTYRALTEAQEARAATTGTYFPAGSDEEERFELSSASDLQAKFNELGRQGWRLLVHDGSESSLAEIDTYWFVREVESPR